MPIVQELSVDRIPLGLCCRVQALVLKGAVRVNRKGQVEGRWCIRGGMSIFWLLAHESRNGN